MLHITAHSVTFECDLTTLLCHLQVLKLLDSPQGTIAPGGTAGLNFIFSPLEARDYSITLPIKLGNGAKSALHIIGAGYNPLAAPGQSSDTSNDSFGSQQRVTWESQILGSTADKASWPGFSTASLVQLPRQLLSLSHGVVSFGPVSILGVSKQVIALTAGADFGVEFEWRLEALARDKQLLDGCLQVEPMRGQLAPNGCCLCRLTFTAGLHVQLFEAGIKCLVTPVAEAVSPLQPARVPSINSPLNSPRRSASGSSSQAEPSSAVAGQLSTAQHGRRSPRLASSPEKSARAERGLAGAPVKQGSPSSSPSKDKGRSSQNRAPVSRTSSSVSSPGGHQGISPRKSPQKSPAVRAAKATSPVRAAGKASSTSTTASGRHGSLTGSGAKTTARSPHKPRRESGQLICANQCDDQCWSRWLSDQFLRR